MFKLKNADLSFNFMTDSDEFLINAGTKIKIKVKDSSINKGTHEGIITKILSNMIILDGIIHIYTNEILEFEIL